MKQILVIFGRGLIYSLAFWLVYTVIYHPPWQRQASTDNDARTEAYWKAQEEQQARSEKLFEAAEQQSKRMDAFMSRQEELSQRFEAVITRWEKQVGIKR